MADRIFRVAIDGPSGSGKSTIAKAIAKKLSIDYIDTGAMYRAVGLKMIKNNVSMEESPKLFAILKDTEIDFQAGNIILDGAIVNELIRTQEVSTAASDCSALGAVREKLVELQRKMGESKSVIMDGRDIGTNVLKDAEYKFFLTADDEERARRRFKELKEKGEEVTFEEVLAKLRERDYNDSHRKLNPLRKAEDALEIDSTNLTIEEVVKLICDKIEK